jgi:hypothetical protein
MFTFSPELKPQSPIAAQLIGRKITTKTYNNLRQLGPNGSLRFGPIKTILNPNLTLQILGVDDRGKAADGVAIWAHVRLVQ